MVTLTYIVFVKRFKTYVIFHPNKQIDPNTNYIKGGEDCLVVSVYTPNPKLEQPVFVWLHGNAFHKGSGNADLHGPNRIMDHGVVMVTMNFRLGPLGFMSLEDDILPGNLGLWDQKLALDWIQLNIASFGGDPSKVPGSSPKLLHFQYIQ